MKGNELIYAACLAMVLQAGCRTNPYVGTWSNRQSEVRNMSFISLWGGGKGVYSTADLPIRFRWTNATDGIIVAMGAEGMTTNLFLRYEESQSVWVLDKPNGQSEVFFRISADEPPDYEGQYRERLASRNELYNRVLLFADDTNSVAHLMMIASNGKWFSLTGNQQMTMIHFKVLAAGSIPGGIGLLWAKERPESRLKPKQLVKQERVDELMAWCKARNIPCNTSFYFYRDSDRIAGYLQYCDAWTTNKIALIDTVQHVLDVTLSPVRMPVQLIKRDR